MSDIYIRFRLTLRKPSKNEQTYSRYYNDILINSDKSIKEIKNILYRLYDKDFSTLIAITNQIFVEKKDNLNDRILMDNKLILQNGQKFTEIGQIPIFDLDNCDLASAIMLSDYIKQKYKLSGKTLIFRTEKGHHLWIIELMPYQQFKTIVMDAVVSSYQDKFHKQYILKDEFAGIRISSTKFGHDNPLSIVYEEEGKKQNEIEKEFEIFLMRLIN